MVIGECMKQYEEVMGKVFPERSWKTMRLTFKGEFFDDKPLEKAIKDLVTRELGDPEGKLMDDSSPCKM
jgi:hypothetical protein